MEPVQQPTQDNRGLQILASVLVGLFSAVLISLIVGGVSIYFLTGSGTPGGIIFMLCIAPLTLLISSTAGLFAGRQAYKALTRVASTRGSRAERRASFSIFGIAGLSVFLAMLAFVIYQVFPLIPGEEREALTKLGYSISWKSPCHQDGVACDGNSLSAHVTHLRIKYQLKSIPPEISHLSHLEVLIVSHKQLSGIPPELFHLSRLKFLDLSDNKLSGPIPPELITLSKLTFLKLSYNQLSGPIPPELGALSSLEDLQLQDNQLSGPIPPELGSLSNLSELILYDNQLSGPIPPEIGALSSLERLELQKNQLSGNLPLEMSALSRLKVFSFNNTDLCEPQDAAFQEWLSGIKYLARTGVACP